MPNIREKLTRAGLNQAIFANDDSYNTYANLESADIEAVALLKMGGTLNDSGPDVASSHYFSGLKLNDSQDFEQLFIPGRQGLADGDFDIDKALEAIDSGKPAYININAHSHHAVIKICQDPNNREQIQVRYYNPMIEKAPWADDDDVFAQRVATMRDEPENNELSEDEIKQIVRSEMDEEMAKIGRSEITGQAKPSVTSPNIGKDFARSLIKFLNANGKNVKDNLIDDSQDHQHKNCCGLACADYIAGTAPQPGMSAQERESYYKKSGQEFIEAITTSRNMDEMEANQRNDLKLSEDISENEKKVVKTLLEASGLDNSEHKGERILEALIATGLLEEGDLPELEANKDYSYEAISKIMKGTQFVNEQAIGNLQGEKILSTRGDKQQKSAKQFLTGLGMNRENKEKYTMDQLLNTIDSKQNQIGARVIAQIKQELQAYLIKPSFEGSKYTYGNVEDAMKNTTFIKEQVIANERDEVRGHSKPRSITGNINDLRASRNIRPTPTPHVKKDSHNGLKR